MAELHQYKCSCGHEVWADTRGYFPLFSGMIIQFRCKKCKDVVQLPVKDLNEHFPFFKCPECGSEHDRDVNAAVNILQKGMETLAA